MVYVLRLAENVGLVVQSVLLLWRPYQMEISGTLCQAGIVVGMGPFTLSHW